MRPDNNSIGAVILAAGSSSRLGQPKQLLQVGGESLLRRTTRIALETGCRPVVVVLGADMERMWEEIADLRVEIVVNFGWESGMATSLRAGLQGMIMSPAPPTSTFLLVCDQPYLSKEVLMDLAQARAEKGRIAAVSVYDSGAIGTPCLFTAPLYPELLSLKGEQGARKLIARLTLEQVACVPFPQGEIDVDTPEDWEQISKELETPRD